MHSKPAERRSSPSPPAAGEGGDAVGTDATQLAVEVGILHRQLGERRRDRRVLSVQSSPSASQAAPSAVDAGGHAVAVELDFVQPARPARRLVDQLAKLRRDKGRGRRRPCRRRPPGGCRAASRSCRTRHENPLVNRSFGRERANNLGSNCTTLPDPLERAALSGDHRWFRAVDHRPDLVVDRKQRRKSSRAVWDVAGPFATGAGNGDRSRASRHGYPQAGLRSGKHAEPNSTDDQ